MSSPFFGLNIGASALRTAQTLVDITNQNIANANTPGYSRQSAVVTPTSPYPIPVFSAAGTPGQLGTGVQITEVNRARNTFVDLQMRNQLNTQGQVDAHRDALTQVEAVVNEPSTTGMSATMTKYWAAWHEVANSPSDAAVRTNLVQQGIAVATGFQSTVAQYKQQQTDLDTQVGFAVSSVNTLAQQIADINKQVSLVENSGMHANDLRDQRDLLVDKLSSFVKINAVESADGQVNINVGNHQLVDRNTARPMVTNVTAGTFSQVQWADGITATTTGSSAAQNIGTGGTILINGISVALGTGNIPSATVSAINGTAGLGATGAVTASLNSAGKLVLTSNTSGATGTVTVGATAPAGNTIYANLGLTAGTVSGANPTAVILGGGKLQGLVDSRDVLLKERIDATNLLASRVIESVNGVSQSGVGLDGIGGRKFFAGTDATNIAIDPGLTAAGGTDKIAAARMYADPAAASGYSSAVGDNSNAVAMAQLQSVVAQRMTGGTAMVPGQPLGGATLLGIDLSGAAASTTYTFSVVAGSPPTVSATPGSGTNAGLTIGPDGVTPANSVVTVDTGAGRLTISTPTLATANLTLSAALASLNGQTVTTMAGPASMGDQYAQGIATLGTESAAAKGQSANQVVLISQLTTQRQQTSGVSLDEETINLMMYQKAYQSAARVITVMDSMLDTLINNTGRVGR